MAYTGRAPSAAPLTSADINDGAVAPADLSTGAPSWTAGGAVTLPYNGSNKLATTSTGIDVTGTVTADGLTVDKEGNDHLKITDTSSSNALEIGIGNSVAQISVDPTNSIASSDIRFSVDGNYVLNLAEGGDISFYEDTGTTPKFFWDASAEHLGIGTSSPDGALTVVKSTNTVSEPTLKLQNGGGSAALLSFYNSDGSTLFGDIKRITNSISINSENFFAFRVNDTERMRIDSSGNLLVGTTSAVDKLTVSGDAYVSGGIHLGGTGSANYLDDYEEGNWTPVLEGSTGNPTVTYGASTGGRYTKIGRVVMVKCDIDIAAISGGSGTARISGLPFASEGFPAWDSAVFRDADAIKISGQTYRITGWFGTSLFYLTYVGYTTSHSGDAPLDLSNIGTGRIQFTTWFNV